MDFSSGNSTKTIFQLLLFTVVSGFCNFVNAQTWIPAFSGSFPAAPTAIVTDETLSQLTVRFDFAGIYAEDVTTGQGTFQRIHFGNNTNCTASDPGTPALPQLTEIIKAPVGYKVQIKSVTADWHEAGEYRLYPQQLPLRDGEVDKGFQFDATAYQSTETFPENIASVGNMQGWGGVPVTGLSVIPLRYTPASGQLEIASSVMVHLEFIPDPDQNIIVPQVQSYRMNRLHQASILNPPPVNPRPLDADENEPVRLLFILLEEALETAQPLIDFHHASGMRSEVWLADEIEDEFEIKQRIVEMFEEGLEYVLIIGDGYVDNPHVPMHFWDPEDPPEPVEGDNGPTASDSDTWFTCLDPPDEAGFDDHLPELAIGRLVYETNNLDQLQVQVGKLIDYIYWNGENRDNNAIARALVIADNPTNGNQHDDELEYFIGTKRLISEADYNFPAPNFIQAFGDQNGITDQFLIERMNEGVGIVNYRGHGDHTMWASWNIAGQSFSNVDVRNLENIGNPFILISSACNTGDIAQYGNNANADCLLETFQKHEGGSVSAHGCIISTWRWANSQFDETIFSAWFNNGIYDLGYSANLASTEMVVRWDASQWPVLGRMNFRTYVWLGDPMLEIKIEAPDELRVIVPEFVPVGVEELEVRILINDQNLPGARFCIRSENDDIYIAATTDSAGFATIVFEDPPAEVMALHWMAYHRNGIPVEGEILVIEGQGVVFGSVRDFANDEAIENAELELTRFGLDAGTDQAGNFRFEGVPIGEDRLIVNYEGFISQAMDVMVGEEELQVDFEMLFSHLVTDPEAIIENSVFGEEPDEQTITLSNSGNGDLIWQSGIDFEAGQERFGLTHDFNPLEVFDDDRLCGVAVINDRVYIAGGNNSNEPNFLYVFNTDFDSLGMFRQPDLCVGIGLRDLDASAGFVYGSSDDRILKMVINDLDIEVTEIINGPYNPNRAIAVDDDENLWVGDGRMPLVKIDQEGNVLQTIDNNLNVQALAWSPFETDGHNLFAFVQGDGDEPVRLYAINPTTNSIQYAANLTVEADEVTANSLTITNNIIPGQTSIVGIVNHGADRHLRVWNLRNMTDWVTIEPLEGVIPPNESTDIVLTFDTEGLSNQHLVLAATLFIDGNSNNPHTEIDVTLEIEPNSVQSEADATVPDDLFTVYPNPFNSEVSIEYRISRTERVKLVLCDISGREVRVVYDGFQFAGQHQETVNMSSFPSGIYLTRLEVGAVATTKKIVCVK